MSKIDLALYSKNIIIDNETKSGYILISDGKIIDIVSEFDNKNIEVHDYSNETIISGIVDCHVHINEPGRTDWEGFETATKAALAGGITTLIDMPLNCSPVTTTLNALNIKMEEVKNKLWVDCGFWGGIIPNNFENIEPLLKAGVMGCKVFLIDSGIDEFPNVTEDDLRQALPLLKKYNLPLIVHAEIEDYEGQTSNYNNPKSYQAFLDSRPKNIED
ncbi:MAG: amidohydrolase family protein, partial [Candidatus Sericytochromatia bacterium]